MNAQEQSLIERAAKAEPIRVPAGLKRDEAELQRLSARFRACGLKDPFQENTLKGTAPRVLRGVLAAARAQGLLDEGPIWSQRLERLSVLAEGTRRALNQELELDRAVPKGPDGRGL